MRAIISISRSTLSVLILSLAIGQPAAAEALTYVDYMVRETPTDPESNVVYIMSLGMVEEEVQSEGILWRIAEFIIVEPGEGQESDTVWIEEDPYVDTVDGLWFVEHADTAKPEAEEFHSPPLMFGTAKADDPNDDDMEYDFSGVECAAPPGEPAMYDGRVSSLTFELTLEGRAQPEAAGDDDPAEVDPPETDPPYEQE